MSEEKKSGKKPKEKDIETAGYQPLKKGYQPTQGQLDSSNPPEGVSGVSKEKIDKGEEEK